MDEGEEGDVVVDEQKSHQLSATGFGKEWNPMAP
jgi:hypothetical protein